MKSTPNVAEQVARVLPLSHRQIAVIFGLDALDVKRIASDLVRARIAREHVCKQTGKLFLVSRTRVSAEVQHQNAQHAVRVTSSGWSGTGRLTQKHVPKPTPWRSGGSWNRRAAA